MGTPQAGSNLSKSHYAQKDGEYFANVRMDVISLIPDNPEQKILEIGSGAANTLVYIKETNLAREVMGVELMTIEDSHQNNPVIDKFQITNIEQEEIDAPLNYFDVIICADVLEHLVDPWAAITKISTHLKPGGIVIVSMPNIREYKTIFKIMLKGDFRYQTEGGIMDRTHLRFFCRKNINELLTTETLTPIYCKPNFLLPVVKEGRTRRIMNNLSLRLFQDFLAVQYLFICKKTADGTSVYRYSQLP